MQSIPQKIKTHLIKILLTWVLLAWIHPAFAFENGDIQYFCLTQFQKSLSPRWKIYFNEELRWENNLSEFYFHRPEAGFAYQVSEMTTVSFYFKQLNMKEKGRWKAVRVPHANIIFNIRARGFSVLNRNRIEYLDNPDRPDFWRYRCIVQIFFPVSLPLLRSQPYVADEVFYHFNNERIKYNRFYIGLSTRLQKAIRLDTYYFYYWIKSSYWMHNHVFGSILSFSF